MTTDPAQLTAPISKVKAVAASAKVDPSSSTSRGSSIKATIAAAPPPTPLNRATSWGICVIWTR